MPPSVSPALPVSSISCFHLGIAGRIERVDFAGVADASLLGERCRARFDLDAAELDHVAEDRDAELREQLLGQRPGGDADGRLAGAGPLQHAADRAEVLDRAGQVAVAGPRAVQVAEPFELVVVVDDLQRDRAAERGAVPDAGEDVDRVGFDPLPAAAAVAALAAPQFDVDRAGVELHARRKAIDQGQQRFAVRFAGGPVAQGHGTYWFTTQNETAQPAASAEPAPARILVRARER